MTGLNKLHNKMKILYWRTGGFVLYYKRLITSKLSV
jgi:hypothetical protein